MKNLLVISAVAVVLFLISTKKAFAAVVSNQQLRGCDPKGCGGFGDSRTGHVHQGIDIVVSPGETVNSPISGTVTRYPFPYGDDLRWTGIEIKNQVYSVKMFYLKAAVPIGATVNAGDPIGVAQDIRTKYGNSITPHVHLEVRETGSGKLLDPTNLF